MNTILRYRKRWLKVTLGKTSKKKLDVYYLKKKPETTVWWLLTTLWNSIKTGIVLRERKHEMVALAIKSEQYLGLKPVTQKLVLTSTGKNAWEKMWNESLFLGTIPWKLCCPTLWHITKYRVTSDGVWWHCINTTTYLWWASRELGGPWILKPTAALVTSCSLYIVLPHIILCQKNSSANLLDLVWVCSAPSHIFHHGWCLCSPLLRASISNEGEM